MLRVLLPICAAMAACSPSPQETAAMRRPSSVSGTLPPSGEATPESPGPAVPDATGDVGGDPEHAAQAPVQQRVSAGGDLAPGLPTDSPAEARGRRTLSTAFVMVGPDGHLTVELNDGRALVLRDVVMRRKDYCGMLVLGGARGVRYCGGYADVAAARPGGGPSSDGSRPADAKPFVPARDPPEHT